MIFIKCGRSFGVPRCLVYFSRPRPLVCPGIRLGGLGVIPRLKIGLSGILKLTAGMETFCRPDVVLSLQILGRSPCIIAVHAEHHPAHLTGLPDFPDFLKKTAGTPEIPRL